MTLHSYTSTVEALTRFVESTGKWPTNWEELIAADRGQSRGWLNSPEGLADLQSRVKVRIDLDLKYIAAMTPEAFSAVEQREPNYGTNDRADRRSPRCGAETTGGQEGPLRCTRQFSGPEAR